MMTSREPDSYLISTLKSQRINPYELLHLQTIYYTQTTPNFEEDCFSKIIAGSATKQFCITSQSIDLFDKIITHCRVEASVKNYGHGKQSCPKNRAGSPFMGSSNSQGKVVSTNSLCSGHQL